MADERQLRRLTQWQETLVADGVLPSAVTLVKRPGDIDYLHACGFRDVATGEPVRDDDLFRLYSMSKPIVSVALMMLFEEGRFQLNDPIHHYLGEAWRKENMSVFSRWRADSDEARKAVDFEVAACATDITMKHVLTHTAGLSYGFDPSGRDIAIDRIYNKTMDNPQRADVPVPDHDVSMLQTFCSGLAEMPLWYQPGTRWNYSYATDVCGRLIEVISGQPLDVFLAERMFGPLGMTETGFDVAPEQADRLVHNYRYVPPDRPAGVVTGDATLRFPHEGGFEDVDRHSRSAYLNQARPKFLSGGGGLVGTIQDYSRFCGMMLGGGVTADGERVIGRKTLQFITSNHLPGGRGLMELAKPPVQYSETSKNGGSFGLGFAIVESPQEAGLIGSVGSFAWGGAAATIFWCDPVEDLHVVFFTQVLGMQPPNMLRAKLGSFVYAALS